MKTMVLALSVLLCWVCGAAAACPGESATAVLDYYAAAYSEQNSAALDTLYSADYAWLIVVPPRADIIDRARTLNAARKMLEAPDVQSATLTFGGDYSVVRGREQGTWRIENVVATLDVKLAPDSEHGFAGEVVSACETLYVREVGEDPVLFEIYREVTFEGIGCGREE